MGGKSDSGPPSTQTITQRAEIPAFLRPFVERGAEISTGALERLEGQLSGAGADQLVAPFDPAQQQALQLAEQRALGAGGFLPTAQEGLSATARGDFLFGNPAFDEAVQASIRAAQPGILSTFGAAGRGRGGLAQVAMQQAASDSFARLFGQERGRQQQAQALLPELALADTNILSQVGGQRQAQAQRELGAPISAEESLLSAALTGLPVSSLLGQQQTGVSRQGFSSNPLASGLGGALTGAQIGTMFGPGIGTGIGAGVGGLLGLLS